MDVEGWVEQGVSYSTRALWLLLVTPLTIGKFMAPPRSSFAVVEFHLDIMFVAPPFLLGGLLGFLDNREPLEQRFQPCQHMLFVSITQGDLDIPSTDIDIDVA